MPFFVRFMNPGTEEAFPFVRVFIPDNTGKGDDAFCVFCGKEVPLICIAEMAKYQFLDIKFATARKSVSGAGTHGCNEEQTESHQFMINY